MSLKAWLSSATSAAWPWISIRWPGRERVDAAHQRGQPLERPEHAAQRQQVDRQHAATPTASTATSLALMRELTVAGDSASTATAATSTAALMAKTRQNRDTTS